MPDGHYFAWGGEFENQQRAVARLRVIVPVALAAVLALLYTRDPVGPRRARRSCSTAPFALTGGVFALSSAACRSR